MLQKVSHVHDSAMQQINDKHKKQDDSTASLPREHCSPQKRLGFCLSLGGTIRLQRSAPGFMSKTTWV